MYEIERNNIAPENIEEFRKTLSKDYDLLIAGEPIGTSTDKNPAGDILAELTARKTHLAELAARKIHEGRLSTDNEPHVMGASGAKGTFQKPAREDLTGPYSAFTVGRTWPGIAVPFQQAGAVSCGVVAPVLMAIAITTNPQLIGFDIFTFDFWSVISIGALLMGLATASGYYFGCWLFRCKATWLLLIQMVIAAGLIPFLMYSFGYSSRALDKGFASPILHGAAEAGGFGYWTTFILPWGLVCGLFVICILFLRRTTPRWSRMSDPSIEIFGRADTIRYTQGSRSIDVQSELLIGKSMLVLYAGSIKKWADGRTVTADEKAEIIENIKRLMRPEWGDIAIE